MKKKQLTVVQILAITSVILLIITTCLVGWLCATIDAFSTALTQNQYKNVDGDYIDNSVNVYIFSEGSIPNNQTNTIDELFTDVVKALISTVVSALFSAISIKLVIIKKDNRKVSVIPSKKDIKKQENDDNAPNIVTVKETKSKKITNTDDETVTITEIKTVTKTVKKKK